MYHKYYEELHQLAKDCRYTCKEMASQKLKLSNSDDGRDDN